jgi:thioredoxin 1
LFWAQWCYCAQNKPHFDEAGQSRDERFVTVDISDEDSPLWDEWDVRKVPTVVRFEDGEEADRVSGVLGETDLEEMLAALE